MDIDKGTRHQKIIGDFGEMLVCNWLSRSGFEVAVVDHTGIDIVAYNPRSGARLGIAVTARTRPRGKENIHVNVLYGKDRRKLEEACTAFACSPWVAIYVETTETADLYLVSLEDAEKQYPGPRHGTFKDWKMDENSKARYRADSKVSHIRFTISPSNWPPALSKLRGAPNAQP